MGTSYGEQKVFTTASTFSPIVFNPELSYETVTDIDGNEYKTTQMGTLPYGITKIVPAAGRS